ncbi:hypothetical protein PS9374_07057 [Planomonospora sphaerica]|uniref:Uncharacterized protein n=1 Tax=Planomonospora sphaerica TaxID=161355 RepID=A0A171DQM6_9ACTN|nr:hypothetical protein PS9374_07057 [Planomonospora sphaerica]
MGADRITGGSFAAYVMPQTTCGRAPRFVTVYIGEKELFQALFPPLVTNALSYYLPFRLSEGLRLVPLGLVSSGGQR